MRESCLPAWRGGWRHEEIHRSEPLSDVAEHASSFRQNLAGVLQSEGLRSFPKHRARARGRHIEEQEDKTWFHCTELQHSRSKVQDLLRFRDDSCVHASLCVPRRPGLLVYLPALFTSCAHINEKQMCLVLPTSPNFLNFPSHRNYIETLNITNELYMEY